jgi:hypothetical protein
VPVRSLKLHWHSRQQHVEYPSLVFFARFFVLVPAQCGQFIGLAPHPFS